jgi:hypothetical protein
MKTFNNLAAQGDILIRRIDKLPDGLVESKPEDGKHILAHSETGHHHVVEAKQTKRFIDPRDTMISYLEVSAEHIDLVHNRSFDTHETLRIPNGIFEIKRQREWTPEGFRRVED